MPLPSLERDTFIEDVERFFGVEERRLDVTRSSIADIAILGQPLAEISAQKARLETPFGTFEGSTEAVARAQMDMLDRRLQRVERILGLTGLVVAPTPREVDRYGEK